MSATIKTAILALKGRIADAYTAISAKGGTVPAEQTAANLPDAIESIPSGGGEVYLASGISFRGLQQEKLGENLIKQAIWNFDGGPIRDLPNAKKIDFSGLNVTSVSSWYSRFWLYNCPLLEEVNVRFASCPLPTGAYHRTWAYGIPNLRVLRVGNWCIYGFDLNTTTSMTRESLVQLLTDLPTPADSSQVINLGAVHLSLLTSDDIAIATSKGWTLA